MERENEVESGALAELKRQNALQVKLIQNKGYQWFSDKGVSVKGYIITSCNTVLRGASLVRHFSSIDSFDSFQQKVKAANGLFSVVIQNKDTLWAAVDIIRAFPLFYLQQGSDTILTDNPDCIIKNNTRVFDQVSTALFRSSGFVPGRKTLLKDVYQVQAGECIEIEKEGKTNREYYYQHLTHTFPKKEYQEWKSELKQLLLRMGERLIKILDNRPVALPLSGGFDSRLIAYFLKKHNYPSVFCFTYGTRDSKEVEISKEVAEKLNYDWLFIDYEAYFGQDFLHSSDFENYINYTCLHTTIPFLQEFFAASHLKYETDRLTPDTVFIPGHAADFIAGSHLRENMNSPSFSVSDRIIDLHFNWIYPLENNKKTVKEYKKGLASTSDEYPSYLRYESWVLKERQAKLIANSSKLWEFYGHEYIFPFWDKEFVHFFRSVPFEYKLHKHLYNDVVSELFEEFDIRLKEKNELTVTPLFVKWIECRRRVKRLFPFLNSYVDIWKNDDLGFRTLTKEIQQELQTKGNERNIVHSGGLFSNWYLQYIGASSIPPSSSSGTSSQNT